MILTRILAPSAARAIVLTKREFVSGVCCTICTAAGRPAAAASSEPLTEGCFISPGEYQRFKLQRQSMGRSDVDELISRDRFRRTTGDSNMDRDLDRAMKNVANLFGVKPAFGFYDPNVDPSKKIMNAWAVVEDTDIPGTKGTVAFGDDLFRSELQYDRSGSTIMAIIAHEFAHVFQGYRGYLTRIHTGYPRKSEINADFLSGYFLGTRKREHPALSLEKVSELFVRLGRLAENNPMRTHGNSKERLDAAQAGFALSYRDNRSFEFAVAAGLDYVGG
jgi:hypothetical protein